MDDRETLNRRARLRELIDSCFEGRDESLLRFIADRTGKRPNQGELSAIQKDHGGKSFGDKKARNLAEQIGLHRRWFDFPMGTNVRRKEWLNESNFFHGEMAVITAYRSLSDTNKAIIGKIIDGLLAKQYVESQNPSAK